MSEDDVITGLGSRKSLLHAAPAAKGRALSQEESALVAAFGPGAAIQDVLGRAGLPEARAISLLIGLRLRGILAAGGQKQDADASTSNTALDEAALAEDVQLSDEQKRDILRTEARCLASDHFTLLGLKPDASGADAKKAYYDLTRRYHPDRFFGKELGSFKDRIYRVFKQITEAQQVLSDPERRGRYLSEHPELTLPAAGPRGPEDEARAAERRARILRHPYLSKQARVHELVTRGRAYLQQGEHTRAYNDLNLAAQMDPGHKEIAELLALAKKGGDKKRAELEFQEAKKLESLPLADRDQVVKHLRNAIALDPDNALYCHTLAKKLIGGGQAADLKEATLLARKSTEKDPSNADYHNTHGDLCMMSGLEKNARREYEAVQKLRPDDEHAKQQLKKLKWK